jgi:hypothetical protein
MKIPEPIPSIPTTTTLHPLAARDLSPLLPLLEPLLLHTSLPLVPLHFNLHPQSHNYAMQHGQRAMQPCACRRPPFTATVRMQHRRAVAARIMGGMGGMSPAALQEAMKDPKMQEAVKQAMQNPAVGVGAGRRGTG